MENVAQRPDPHGEAADKYRPRTKLGRKLWAIRQRGIPEGDRILTWEDLDREVAERRGSIEEASS